MTRSERAAKVAYDEQEENCTVPGAGTIRRDSGLPGRGHDMNLRVECYSGTRANERPVRFYLGDRALVVEEVLDQWYGPKEQFFKVRAGDGHLYILRNQRSRPEGEWTLEAFREGGRDSK